MSTIQLLDCTLRDGGYVNEWNFGEKRIKEIVQNLERSFIEMIECGFLNPNKKVSRDQSIFSSIEAAEQRFDDICSNNLALMINCGDVSADNPPKYQGGAVNTIRIAFHKHQREEAQNLCLALKKNGFKIFFQPMFTMGYNDIELLELISWTNENAVDAFYIVDSFGTMRSNDVLRVFYLVDNNLKPSIKIGFHSHNNLQLSFSNAQELIKIKSRRDIIIDTSVLGMGRGAGNLCTELMAQYINEKMGKKYDIIPVLETMDEYIMPIYTRHPWGYSAPYYIAAVNSCHPNYATYLINCQTLCIKDIDRIIKSIPEEKKALFDKELIQKLYLDYQSHKVNDDDVIKELSQLCEGKKILILAPGKSLLSCREEIQNFIEREEPVVFSINHIPQFYKYDRIFVSNLKRFKRVDDLAGDLKDKLICTSNISTSKNICKVNYDSYLNDDDAVYDNAGLMLINVLNKAGVAEFALAGYDGFHYANGTNYFDDNMINSIDAQRRYKTNEAMTKYFKQMRKSTKVTFITPSMYNCEE